MAGRISRDRHRGRPPKLGCPGFGTLRRLTIGEATATGLTRSSMIVRVEGRTLLFKPCSSAAGIGAFDYVLVDDAGAYAALEEYWREG